MSEMLGNLNLLSLRVEQAIPCFEDLAARNPADPRATHKLAVAWALRGNAKEARRWIHETLERIATVPGCRGRGDDEHTFWEALAESIHAHRAQLGAWRFGIGLAMLKAPESTIFALRLLESIPQQDVESEELRGLVDELNRWKQRIDFVDSTQQKASGPVESNPGRSGARRLMIAAALLLGAGALGAPGCSSDDDSHPMAPLSRGSCVDCHTDQDRLVATADPDETPGPTDSGEG